MECEPNDQQSHMHAETHTKINTNQRFHSNMESGKENWAEKKKSLLIKLKGWWEDDVWRHAAKNNNKFINKVGHAQDYGGFVK